MNKSVPQSHSALFEALMNKNDNEDFGTIIKEWKKRTMVEYDAGL